MINVEKRNYLKLICIEIKIYGRKLAMKIFKCVLSALYENSRWLPQKIRVCTSRTFNASI